MAKNELKTGRSKVLKRIVIILISLVIIGIATLSFLFYGPYKGFREWWITTAMTTMTHQYLATYFFDQSTIDAVLASNKVEEVDAITDTTLIVGITSDRTPEPVTYENEYEKQILAKDLDKDKYNIYAEGEDYRIIKISGKGYTGYLAAIYDPSKIKVAASKYTGKSGQYLTTMVKENDAILGVNGGGFIDENFSSNAAKPHGITISNGEVISSIEYNGPGGLIGFTEDNKLVLGKMTVAQAKALKIRDAVTWGPYLIINGVSSKIYGNGGWGTAPRTVIGQRKDGIVLLLVIDGRKVTAPGADVNDLLEIMENYGAYNAANLDGGTSSAMVLGDKIINDPIDGSGAHRTRYISTAFILTK